MANIAGFSNGEVLPGPAGHARLDFRATPLARRIAVSLVGQSWPRPHSAHLPLEDVDELWYLVQRPVAQESAHPCAGSPALA